MTKAENGTPSAENAGAMESQAGRHLASILSQLTDAGEAANGQDAKKSTRRRLRRALAATQFVFCGYGSIARPIAELLCEQGARQFLIVDPKQYSQRSVASQCAVEEVGQWKAEAGARRLCRQGATNVEVFATDLYWLPDGVVQPRSLIIASVDNRRADIGANRLAARMRSRLLKINIEPSLAYVALRAYDFRRRSGLCAECQFSSQHYLLQRHPRSCDGPGNGRPTNSPRWLSAAAGRLGGLAAAELAFDADSADRWYRHDWQFWLDRGHHESSELTANTQCRWEHGRRWKNLTRLSTGPRDTRLADLLPAAPADHDVRLRFCHDVTWEAGCGNCGHRQPCLRWIVHVEHDLLPCPECGGVLRPVPFCVSDCLSREQVADVLAVPLADWGVAPQAVIEVAHGRKTRAFVVGHGDRPTTSLSAAAANL